MIYTAPQSTFVAPVRRLLPSALMALVQSIATSYAQRRREDAARRTLDNLTFEQLQDVGLQADPRSLMIIDARLMADLMSMR